MKTLQKPASQRLRPSFKATLQSDGTLDLSIYEVIGEDYWSGGGVTAKTVQQSIRDAGLLSRIAVRINSPGGDAFEGIAIYNLLRAQRVPIEVSVDGIAASAASVVAMAGHTVTMGRSAMMMVHNAWTVCAGDQNTMRQCADLLEKISASVAEVYIAKTGKSAAEMKTILDAGAWMSAQECLDGGFATAIAEQGDEAASMALARSFRLLQRMEHLPERLRADSDSDAPTCRDSNGDPCDPDDPDCDPEQSDPGCPCANAQASNLSQYQARLAMLRR